MSSEYGQLTLNIVKWILHIFSIQLTDIQLLLVSILFLIIILCVMISFNSLISKNKGGKLL